MTNSSWLPSPPVARTSPLTCARTLAWTAAGVLLASAVFFGAVPLAADACAADRDCQDGIFCNGRERCAPGDPRADADGCLRAPRLPCSRSEVCLEDEDACRRPCRDADGDGHEARACGGDDCDDGDRNRYPGNVELCDAGEHDEDCNPWTYGTRDEDRDGEIDARCCNRKPDGTQLCGADCDDSNRSVLPNAQVCNGRGVAICADGTFEPAACTPGTVCIPQPNGTGFCGAQPADYQPPPRFIQPRLAPLPALQDLKERLHETPAAVKPRIQLRAPIRPTPAKPPAKKPPKEKKNEGDGGADASR